MRPRAFGSDSAVRDHLHRTRYATRTFLRSSPAPPRPSVSPLGREVPLLLRTCSAGGPSSRLDCQMEWERSLLLMKDRELECWWKMRQRTAVERDRTVRGRGGRSWTGRGETGTRDLARALELCGTSEEKLTLLNHFDASRLQKRCRHEPILTTPRESDEVAGESRAR